MQELFQEYQVDSGEPLLGRGEKRPFRQVQRHHPSYASLRRKDGNFLSTGTKARELFDMVTPKDEISAFLKQK